MSSIFFFSFSYFSPPQTRPYPIFTPHPFFSTCSYSLFLCFLFYALTPIYLPHFVPCVAALIPESGATLTYPPAFGMENPRSVLPTGKVDSRSSLPFSVLPVVPLFYTSASLPSLLLREVHDPPDPVLGSTPSCILFRHGERMVCVEATGKSFS